jgi:hypothetical protein
MKNNLRCPRLHGGFFSAYPEGNVEFGALGFGFRISDLRFNLGCGFEVGHRKKLKNYEKPQAD